MVVAEDSTLTQYEGAFVTSYEKDFKENGRAHIFVCEIEGQTKYVIPVYGAGLWGAIWGYVALFKYRLAQYGYIVGSMSGSIREFATDMDRLPSPVQPVGAIQTTFVRSAKR